MDGDLISRKALLEAIDERERIARKHVPDIQDDELRPTLNSIREFVKNRPAVDAAPVHHGQWEMGCMCSVCGKDYGPKHRMHRAAYRYCPYCGARMDGGGD